MKVGNNTKYEYSYLDNRTGENITYIQTTKWEDGNLMNDGLVDGIKYRKIDNLYYVIAGNKPLNALMLGLKNDGVTRNELVLANALAKLPPNQEIFFPAGTYVFGPLPAKYNIFNIPTAINTDTSGVWLTGEGRGKTGFQILPGCIGIQVTGNLSPRPIRISELTINGPGADSLLEGKVTNNSATKADGSPNPDVGRVIGSGSLDMSNYNFNLLNLWGQGHINNVDIANASGHNVYIFGIPEIKLPGIPFEVTGTSYDLGNNSIRISVDDISKMRNVFNERTCTLNGINHVIGGISKPTGEIFINGVTDIASKSGHQTLVIYPGLGGLIADNSTFTGICNIDFAGGCGMFIRGSDANQTTIFGCSFRENGLWGIDDGSFLGSFFYGTHFSANGKRINQFNVENIFGNHSLTIGPYITRFNTARSGYYGVYTEEGNQGPAQISNTTVVIGGIQAAGVLGDGFKQEGAGMSRLVVDNYSLSKYGFGVAHRQKPNTQIEGTFTSYADSGNITKILFVPTNLADITKVFVGQHVIFYSLNEGIVSKILPNQGIVLGEVVDFFPPKSPTNIPTIGTFIVTQPAYKEGILYHEFADGNIGFGIGSAEVGQNEFSYLKFVDNAVVVDRLKIGNSVKTHTGSLAAYLLNELNQSRKTITQSTVIDIEYTNNKPVSYLCYQGGTLGTLNSNARVSQNGPTINSTLPITNLFTGDYVLIEGNSYIIGQTDSSLTNFYVSPDAVGVNNATIEYSPPLFQPIGFGTGELTKRPTDLHPIYDKGWRWLNTTNNAYTWSTWTGTSWV